MCWILRHFGVLEYSGTVGAYVLGPYIVCICVAQLRLKVAIRNCSIQLSRPLWNDYYSNDCRSPLACLSSGPLTGSATAALWNWTAHDCTGWLLTRRAARVSRSLTPRRWTTRICPGPLVWRRATRVSSRATLTRRTTGVTPGGPLWWTCGWWALTGAAGGPEGRGSTAGGAAAGRLWTSAWARRTTAWVGIVATRCRLSG